MKNMKITNLLKTVTLGLTLAASLNSFARGGGVSGGNPGNNDPTTSWTENEVHAGFQLFSQ